MSFISFDDNTQLYYEDSGPITNQTHVTLVLVHGMGFNAKVYQKLLPIAAKHDFRVIAVYRRDYPPSSPLTDEDLKLLRGSAQDQIKALHQQGAQFAEFLSRLIEKEGIPETVDGHQGGIALIGWSSGSTLVHATLSVLDGVPEAIPTKLTKYLHTVILQDPSPMSFGYPFPPELDMSFLSNEDPAVAFDGLKTYVAGYYTHTDHRSGDLKTLDLGGTPANPSRPPTFSDVPLEDLAPVLTIGPFLGSDAAAFAFTDSSREIIRRAVFDGTLAAKYLPNLRIRYYYGEHTTALLILSMWFFEKALEEIPGPFNRTDKKGRDIKSLGALGGNHLTFWGEPEEALKHWKSCLESYAH